VEKNYNRPDIRETLSRRDPYYDIYLQQKCNHPDARATTSRRGLDMVLHEARYGKSVAQLSVRTASAYIWTPPREIKDRLYLGLLSLYIEASRHVQFTEFGNEFFIA
jgi:hypothetical protein